MHGPSSRVGECLAGKYRLEALLGEGGMGEVYRATHEALGKAVAIKLLKPELAQYREVITRFAREARAAALVRHSNVVEVLDVGADDHGTPFIVQELLQGEDFGALLARHPEGVPPGLAMSVLLPVVDAVAAAHDKGIVHRDLKPENVFLAQVGGVAVPKVLDFGISKLPPSSADSTRLTAADTLMGSPQYMSPEQIRTPRAVDQRSDIWSLGVMLFECLSGRLPFEGAGPEQLFVEVCRGRALSLDEVAPHLPAELGRVVAKCLEPDPARRFESAAELRDALKALRSRPSVGARPEPARASVQPMRTRVDDKAASAHGAPRHSAPVPLELDVTARGSVRPKKAASAPAPPVSATRVDVDATAVDPARTPNSAARTAVDPEAHPAPRASRPASPARTAVDPDAHPAPRASSPLGSARTAVDPDAEAAPRASSPLSPARAAAHTRAEREVEPVEDALSPPEPALSDEDEPELYPIGALDTALALLVLLVLGALVPALQGGRAAESLRLLGDGLPLWGFGVAAALVLACTRTIMLGLESRSYALFGAALGLFLLPGCVVIVSAALGWPRSPLAIQAPLALQALPWAAVAVYAGYAAHAARRALHAREEGRALYAALALLVALGCLAGAGAALWSR